MSKRPLSKQPLPKRLWAVVPAAGSGQRMQASQPKQYLQLAGRTVIEHSLDCLLKPGDLHEISIHQVVVCLAEGDLFWPSLSCAQHAKVSTVLGGQSRAESVLNGLNAIRAQASDDDWVLVHDAARPCLATSDLNKLIEHCYKAQRGAILATPVVETLKQIKIAPDRHHTADESNNTPSQTCTANIASIERTLDRALMARAQTPQMFPLVQLFQALSDALSQQSSVVDRASATIDGASATTNRASEITDEASAMELAGHEVDIIWGGEQNIKVTTPSDLKLAEFLLQNKASEIQ